MAETSGFFNAEKLSNGNYDRVYLAANFASYFASFVSNGVFGNKMGALQVVLNEGNFGVNVQSGQGFINGYWYQNDSAVAFELVESDTQPRIDSVVLRLDFVTRSIKLAMLTGTPSVSPNAPMLTRNANVWELCLATINVPANATEIMPQDIIDTRLDSHLCGFVHGMVDQLDTTEYGNRLNGFIDNYITQANAEYQGFLDVFNEFLVWLASQKSYSTEQLQELTGEWNDWLTTHQSSSAQQIQDLTEQWTNWLASQQNSSTEHIQDLTDEWNGWLVMQRNDSTQQLQDLTLEWNNWLATQKSSSTQQIQDLVEQLEQIVDAGDVGLILSRLNALYALQPNTEIAAIYHGLGQYPAVTVYEYQGGTMGEDGIVADAELTQISCSYDLTDADNLVLRVKSGYGEVEAVTKVTDTVYRIDFADSDLHLYIKLGEQGAGSQGTARLETVEARLETAEARLDRFVPIRNTFAPIMISADGAENLMNTADVMLMRVGNMVTLSYHGITRNATIANTVSLLAIPKGYRPKADVTSVNVMPAGTITISRPLTGTSVFPDNPGTNVENVLASHRKEWVLRHSTNPLAVNTPLSFSLSWMTADEMPPEPSTEPLPESMAFAPVMLSAAGEAENFTTPFVGTLRRKGNRITLNCQGVSRNAAIANTVSLLAIPDGYRPMANVISTNILPAGTVTISRPTTGTTVFPDNPGVNVVDVAASNRTEWVLRHSATINANTPVTFEMSWQTADAMPPEPDRAPERNAFAPVMLNGANEPGVLTSAFAARLYRKGNRVTLDCQGVNRNVQTNAGISLLAIPEGFRPTAVITSTNVLPAGTLTISRPNSGISVFPDTPGVNVADVSVSNRSEWVLRHSANIAASATVSFNMSWLTTDEMPEEPETERSTFATAMISGAGEANIFTSPNVGILYRRGNRVTLDCQGINRNAQTNAGISLLAIPEGYRPKANVVSANVLPGGTITVSRPTTGTTVFPDAPGLNVADLAASNRTEWVLRHSANIAVNAPVSFIMTWLTDDEMPPEPDLTPLPERTTIATAMISGAGEANIFTSPNVATLLRTGNLVKLTCNGVNRNAQTNAGISLLAIPEGYRPKANVTSANILPAGTVTVSRPTTGTTVFPDNPGVNVADVLNSERSEYVLRHSANIAANTAVTFEMIWQTDDEMPEEPDLTPLPERTAIAPVMISAAGEAQTFTSPFVATLLRRGDRVTLSCNGVTRNAATATSLSILAIPEGYRPMAKVTSTNVTPGGGAPGGVVSISRPTTGTSVFPDNPGVNVVDVAASERTEYVVRHSGINGWANNVATYGNAIGANTAITFEMTWLTADELPEEPSTEPETERTAFATAMISEAGGANIFMSPNVATLYRKGDRVTLTCNGTHRNASTAATVSLLAIPEGYRPKANVTSVNVTPAGTVTISRPTTGTTVFPDNPGVNVVDLAASDRSEYVLRHSAATAVNVAVSFVMTWLTGDTMPPEPDTEPEPERTAVAPVMMSGAGEASIFTSQFVATLYRKGDRVTLTCNGVNRNAQTNAGVSLLAIPEGFRPKAQVTSANVTPGGTITISRPTSGTTVFPDAPGLNVADVLNSERTEYVLRHSANIAVNAAVTFEMTWLTGDELSPEPDTEPEPERNTFAPVMLSGANEGILFTTAFVAMLRRKGNLVTLNCQGVHRSVQTNTGVSLLAIPEGYRPKAQVTSANVLPAGTITISRPTTGTSVFPDDPATNVADVAASNRPEYVLRHSANIAASVAVSFDMSWYTDDEMPDGIHTH